MKKVILFVLMTLICSFAFLAVSCDKVVDVPSEYSIEYYFEADNGDFILDSTKTENKEANKGTSISLETKTFEGYKFDNGNTLNVLSGTVTDGKIALKAYYLKLRNITVEYYFEQANGEFLVDSSKTYTKTGYKGDTVSIEVKPFDGYKYDSTNQSNKISTQVIAGENKLISYYLLQRSVAVEIYLETINGNFSIDSSLTTYKTGYIGDTVSDTAKEIEG